MLKLIRFLEFFKTAVKLNFYIIYVKRFIALLKPIKVTLKFSFE